MKKKRQPQVRVYKLSMLICLALLLSAINMPVSGMEPPGNKDSTVQVTALHRQLMDRQVSELMASHISDPSRDMTRSALEYMSLNVAKLRETESLRFPADELYGSWDTCWVNPFRSREVVYPDSFQIDCSTFVQPTPEEKELWVTSRYGPRRRRMHRGIDLRVAIGDTIRSAFAGKVRVKNFERRGYGKYLVIRHPNGLETVYGHLSQYLVTENEIVMAGQPIALGGNTGRSTGPHLHFETRFLGMAIDPSQIIDFETGKPHDDLYTFRKRIDNYGRVYTSTSEHFVYHRVKEGETLGAIARRYHTSVDELCHLNGLKRTSTLRIGQSIRCGVEYTKPKPTESPGAASTINNNVIEEPEIVQRPASYHTVQSGETLSSIARQHGTTVSNICRLNDILSTDRLRIGQILCYRAEAKKPVKKPVQESVQTKESVSTEYQSVSSTPEILASSEELNGESDHEDEYEHDIYDDTENTDNQEDTGEVLASTDNSTEVAPATPTKTSSESAKSEGMVLVQRPVFVATAKPAPERKPKSSPRLFQKSDPSKSNTAKDSQSIDNEDTTSSESTETGDPSESIINQESSVDKQDDQSGETASAAVSEEPKSVAAQNVKAEPQSPVYHVIKKGDTLEKIARRYGVSIKRICKINNITTTTTLRIGRSLRCS